MPDDLCIRIGEVLLSSGEGSGETTETMLRVADAFGFSAVDVDITFTTITICCHRGMAATPTTSMRLVTHRGLDLTLLAKGASPFSCPDSPWWAPCRTGSAATT